MPHTSSFPKLTNPIHAFLFLSFIYGSIIESYAERGPTDTFQFDVIVYESTPAGVAAAVSAAREGAEVGLLARTQHVGGMCSGRISCALAFMIADGEELMLIWRRPGICFLHVCVYVYK